MVIHERTRGSTTIFVKQRKKSIKKFFGLDSICLGVIRCSGKCSMLKINVQLVTMQLCDFYFGVFFLRQIKLMSNVQHRGRCRKNRLNTTLSVDDKMCNMIEMHEQWWSIQVIEIPIRRIYLNREIVELIHDEMSAPGTVPWFFLGAKISHFTKIWCGMGINFDDIVTGECPVQFGFTDECSSFVVDAVLQL